MSEMSSIQDSLQSKLDQLECHFTWDIKKEDLVLTNILNKLEEQAKVGLGGEQGVARTHCSLGYVKFLLGRKEEALTDLSKSETLIKENLGVNCDKTLIVTYGNFAWINYHMKKYTESESYLMKLQKINETFSNEPSSEVSEVLGEKGWAYLKFSRKYYEKAAKVFQKAVKLDPENSEWNVGYAIALYRTETSKDFTVDSPAIKQLRQTIDIDPDDDASRVLLGVKLLLCSKELMNESEKLVETALKGSPENPDVLRYVGKFYRNQGSVDTSVALLKKALEKSPNPSFIHHQLAMCYKTKKIKLQKEKRRVNRVLFTEINNARNQCIYHLEKATSLKASFVIAMCELAHQYGEKRDLSKAEKLFVKTFKTAREKNDSVHVVHYYYAEFQQYCKRREDLAIRHYKQCLEMSAHTNEGDRSAEKLINIAQRHMKDDRGNWKANEILGFVYQKKGEMFGDTKSYEAPSGSEEDDESLSNLCEINCKI